MWLVCKSTWVVGVVLAYLHHSGDVTRDTSSEEFGGMQDRSTNNGAILPGDGQMMRTPPPSRWYLAPVCTMNVGIVY